MSKDERNKSRNILEKAFRKTFNDTGDWDIQLRDLEHGGYGWYSAIIIALDLALQEGYCNIEEFKEFVEQVQNEEYALDLILDKLEEL